MTKMSWICATTADGTKYYGKCRRLENGRRVYWCGQPPPDFTPLVEVRALSALEVLALIAE